MDKYTKVELVLIYSGIAIFLTFILLPFFEMFMTSLRPLDHLFRLPINSGLMILVLKHIIKCGKQYHCLDDIYGIQFTYHRWLPY